MSSLTGAGPTGRSSGLKGTGMNLVSTPNKNPGQMDLLQQLMGGSKQGVSQGLEHLTNLAGGGNEEFWNKQEAPAYRALSAIQGNTASRFSGMGSGSRNSSGFQNVMGEQGRTLAESLGANRSQMQQSAIQQLMELSQMLLGQNTHENFLMPKKKSLWEQLLGAGAQGVGSGLGGLGAGFGSMWGMSKFLG